ncbi:hypothetical protein RhiirA5_432881 [Rhizophagus irregularis]|uniref:Uncharacterized protein n=1 Tax=Rhizophagus irregularis TaxID=588596 RepID=A0A2N0NSK8_9GLOM|nr:hypothetical protein RhiirA5_432881 [Rhizophagus irregularis]
MVKTLSNDIRWHIIYHQLYGFSANETALRPYIGITTLQKAAKERSELLRSVPMYKIGSEFKPEQLVFIDEMSEDERTLTADIIEGNCNKGRFQTFILIQVLPQMNEYPNKNSVIVIGPRNMYKRVRFEFAYFELKKS